MANKQLKRKTNKALSDYFNIQGEKRKSITQQNMLTHLQDLDIDKEKAGADLLELFFNSEIKRFWKNARSNNNAFRSGQLDIFGYEHMPIIYPDNSMGKMHKATWEFHQIREQRQKKHIKDSQNVYRLEQEVRDQIEPFMRDDPFMTTGEALRLAGLLKEPYEEQLAINPELEPA
jgi:hypothetical protein